jgi:hypothetical protein
MTSVGCYLILKKKLWSWFFEKLKKKKKKLKNLQFQIFEFFLGINKIWFQFSANFQNNKTFGFGFFFIKKPSKNSSDDWQGASNL